MGTVQEIIVIAISAVFGFVVCYLLIASKIADLNDEISILRLGIQELLDDNIKLHYTVFGVDLASQSDFAASHMEG